MNDPIKLFKQWLEIAQKHQEIKEPTAMTLATCSHEGTPSARIVLLKGVDDRGFVFFTNLLSRKSEDLKVNPFAALCFYWESLGKQVRVEGKVSPVSEVEANEYFASRPRGSQVSAWASKQSQILESRQLLDDQIVKLSNTYEGATIPRPKHWSGWRVYPSSIEFWMQGDDRAHDRWLFRRATETSWTRTLLYP